MIKPSIKKGFFTFIMIFFAGIFICKNTVLYSSDTLTSFVSDSSNMIGYQFDGDIYHSETTDGYLYLPIDVSSVNTLSLNFEKPLNENTTFNLYAQDSNREFLLETRNVRRGIQAVNFYFSSDDYSALRIQMIAPDNSYLSPVSSITGSLSIRHFNFIQHKPIWIMTISCIIMIALILSIIKFKIAYVHPTTKISVSSKDYRDSNIELLRCLCMLLLVAHHYAVHGGLLTLEPSIQKTTGLIFLPAGKICFIAFIAISMYFLVDGKAKFERFLRCWLEVLFYSVSLTILTWINGGIVTPRDLISSFFVMTSNSHGFAASYLLFLLIYPFLLKMTKDISKAQARYLLVILFLVQIWSQIMKTWTGYTQPVFSELTLFVFCYVLSLNLKLYPFKMQSALTIIAPWLLIIIYICCFLLHFYAYEGNLNPFFSLIQQTTCDESSILYIIGGYTLFYVFLQLQISSHPLINKIAQCTFGILLIHDHNFFRHIFWNQFIITESWYHAPVLSFIIQFIIYIICIFGCMALIDYIRQATLEKIIINTRIFKLISNKMNQMLRSL